MIAAIAFSLAAGLVIGLAFDLFVLCLFSFGLGLAALATCAPLGFAKAFLIATALALTLLIGFAGGLMSRAAPFGRYIRDAARSFRRSQS